MLSKPAVIGVVILKSSFARFALAGLFLVVSTPEFAAASVSPPAAISVKIVTTEGAVSPGTAMQFVVRVDNSGGDIGPGNRLLVELPSGLSHAHWICSAIAAGHCATASGSGALNEALDGLSAGATLEYVFRADVAEATTAFLKISADAKLGETARCANGATAPCRDTLSVSTGVGIMLDIRSLATAIPGQQINYVVSAHSVSSNSSSAGTVLRSPVPDGLFDSHWRCHSSVGACAVSSGQGGIDQVLGDFSRGDLSFDITATVASNAPAKITQAAVAIPPQGGSCAVARNGAMQFRSSPCTTRHELATSANILVSRSEDYRPDASTVINRFVLDNQGSAADGSVIELAPAAGVARLDWTCSSQGATCPQASGTGAIHHTVSSWPASGRLIYDLASRQGSSAAQAAHVSLQVTPNVRGICAVEPGSTMCTVSRALPPEYPGLQLSQTVDRLGARSGDVVNIVVSVGNDTSALAARDIVLSVPLPQGISAFASWTCSEGDASPTTCPLRSGSGAIRQRFDELAPSAKLSYSIQARVGSLPPVTVVSRATLTAPASASLGCASSDGTVLPCVASSQFSTVPVLALDQSMSASTLAPGSAVDYVLDVFNLGAKADVVQIRNFLPLGLKNSSWICNGLGIDCPSASGHGDVASNVSNMPSGSGVRYQISAQVDSSQPATASSVLTAVPAIGGRCQDGASGSLGSVPCVNRNLTSYVPKLELSQSASEQQLLRGGVLHHSLIIKNLGGPTRDARVVLPMAPGILRSEWTCAGFGGAVCPQESGSSAIDATLGDLSFAAYLRYSIRSVLAENAPVAISSVAKTTPAGMAQCADDGCESRLSVAVTDVPSAHLSMRATSIERTARAGETATWIIDVRNLGSEAAGRFSIASEPANTGVSINGWTCAGAECPVAGGVGPINQVIESLAIYDASSSEESVAPGRLLFKISGTIVGTAGAQLGVLLGPPAADTCAPVSCHAGFFLPSEALGTTQASLDLVADSAAAYPNSLIKYSFTVANTGGATIVNLPVYNMEPAGIVASSWTCLGQGGAGCSPSGTGAINEVIPVMPPGSSVTFKIDAQTASNLPPQLDYVVGATLTSPALCVPSSCMVTLSLPNGIPRLGLSLVADVGTVQPNSTINYTFTIANPGPSDAIPFDIAALDSAEFISSSWTCQGSGGSTCAPSGIGELSQSIGFFPAGATLTYVVTADVGSTMSPPIDYVVSLFPGAGQAGGLACIPASCSVSRSLPRPPINPAVLDVSKNADRTELVAGGRVAYTVRVANDSNVVATSVRMIDVIPFGLSGFTWACAGSGGVSCVSGSGTGSLDEYFESMPPGSSVTYSVNAVVSASASISITNSVQVSGANIVCNPSNCQGISSLPVRPRADIVVSKSASPPAGTRVGSNDSIAWTLLANNTGGATQTSLLLRDVLPTSVVNISVSPGAGIQCDNVSPVPGSTLTCTIPPGFSGQKSVTITASVRSGASGAVVNSVSATGVIGVQCVTCTTSNPIGDAIDLALVNPRAFSAGAIAGTLIDVVNLSPVTSPGASLTVSPASALRLLSAFSSACTATTIANGNISVSVSCPNPPQSQGISCLGATCTLGSIAPGAAMTVFVALNGTSAATVQLNAAGDIDGTNNAIELPQGGTP